jgi:hypothetical protein
MKRALVRGSVALAVALSLGGFAASPAGAATAQSCAKFAGSITLSPGLGTVPANQKVTIKGAQSACKPTATTGGTGAFLAQFTLKNASCVTLAKGGTTFTAAAKTTWKNKKTTSYNITYKDGTGGNVTNITMTGKATSGLFAGKKFAGGLKINLNSVNSGACTGSNFKSAKLTQLKAWTLS